jgi:MEMO1 family protein
MLDLVRRRFTVDDFHKMADDGVLASDERVELLEGEIVRMSPIGSRHAASVDRLNRLSAPLMLQRRAVVRVQGPLRLNSWTEVYPDLLLLRPRDDDYQHGFPGPGDVLLLIEVSDTTLRFDRQVKLPLYAQSGVPEVWIVDLVAERVLVHRDPMQGEYSVHPVWQGDSLAPRAFPDAQISVNDVLG